MTQLEIIELLKHFMDAGKIYQQTLCEVLILEIRGPNIYDQHGGIWSISHVLREILVGKWQIYKEKPQLVWHKVIQSRMGEYGLRSEYWITSCTNYSIIPAIDRFLLFYNTVLLEKSDNINSLKELAQKHYKENN